MPCAIKGLATQDNFLCAQLLWTDNEYCANLQTSISSITPVQVLMYMHKLCVKSHSHELLDCLGREFLNWENFSKAIAKDRPFGKICTVRRVFLTKGKFDEFDKFLVTSIFNSSNSYWTSITLLESKHSSKLNSSMLENCEFIKFSFHQKYPAYGT